MSKITNKKRLNHLEQSIFLDSKYFHAMSEEKAKDYLNCIHTLLTSNDHISLEACLSNMHLMTKNIKINPEVKKYNLQVAKKMIDKKISDSNINKVLGISDFVELLLLTKQFFWGSIAIFYLSKQKGNYQYT